MFWAISVVFFAWMLVMLGRARTLVAQLAIATALLGVGVMVLSTQEETAREMFLLFEFVFAVLALLLVMQLPEEVGKWAYCNEDGSATVYILTSDGIVHKFEAWVWADMFYTSTAEAVTNWRTDKPDYAEGKLPSNVEV